MNLIVIWVIILIWSESLTPEEGRGRARDGRSGPLRSLAPVMRDAILSSQIQHLSRHDLGMISIHGLQTVEQRAHLEHGSSILGVLVETDGVTGAIREEQSLKEQTHRLAHLHID